MSAESREPIQVEVTIAAPPERVWQIVRDVARMGEWSPECRKVIVWRRGGPRRGAWVTGINRRRIVVWPSNSKIDTYDEGRAIAWRTLESGARWIYELEPVGAGTRLVERRELPDGMTWLARVFARSALGGIDSHADELRDGMQTTVERIKAEVEAS
jgi:uncharacterized protein YndB with AHSA1/START domain